MRAYYLLLPILAGFTGSLTQAANLKLVAQWDNFTRANAAGGILPTSGASVTDGTPWVLTPGAGNTASGATLTFGGTDCATIAVPAGAAYTVGGYDQNVDGFTVVMTVSNATSENRNEVLWTLNRSGMNNQIGASLHSGGAGAQGIWQHAYRTNGTSSAFPYDASRHTFLTVCDRDNYTKIYRDGVIVRHDNGLRGNFSLATSFSIGGQASGAGNRGFATYTLHRIAIYSGSNSASWTDATKQYIADASLSWGAAEGAWSASSGETLWFTSMLAPSAFANGVNACFYDLEAAEAAVTVTGNVAPASVVFDNAATGYTLSGDGSITGATSLVKRGGGTLSLQNGNAFTGGLVIEGGTVVERALNTHQGTLGTGKNAWASKVTLKNGTFDLNNAKNYRNNNQTGAAYWAWLTTHTLTVGGMAGNAVIQNGPLGLGADDALVYDATGNPGTATIASPWALTGSSSKIATRRITVGDSAATDVELDFTGGISGEDFLEGCGTVLVKTGPGTMRIACENYLPGLTIDAGKVVLASAQALGKRHTTGGNGILENTVAVNATLDLGGFDQAIEYLAGNASGVITSAEPATLTVGHATETAAKTYAGAIRGAATLAKTGPAPLALTGSIQTGGTLNFPAGTSVSIPAALAGGIAPVQLGRVPALAGLTLNVTDAILLGAGEYPAVSWGEEIAPAGFTLPQVTGLLAGQALTLNAARTALVVRMEQANPLVKIMPLGDSITEGSSGGQNYRGPLSRLLADAGYRPDFVGPRTIKPEQTIPGCADHCGWSGARIIGAGARTGLLENIDTYLDVTGYPDAILLMIGANDLNGGLAPETAFENWVKLVQRIVLLRPQSQIIAATVLPFQNGHAAVPAFNALLQDLFTAGALNAAGVIRFGSAAKISLVDPYSAVPQDGANYLDALHPNWVGHEKLAETWLAGIQRVLPNSGPAGDPVILRAVNSLDLAQKQIVLTYNKELAEETVDPAAFTVEGGTVTAAALEADARTVTLTLADELTAGAECRVNGFTFTARTLGPESNVAPDLLAGYIRVKTLDVPTGNAIAYANAAAGLPETFDRIGYYLELVHANNPHDLRYIWVSMDAFTADIAQVGVPTSFTAQQKVSNLNVASNVSQVRGVTGPGVSGIIEFTPGGIAAAGAGKGFPADPDTAFYGWDDTINAASTYGAMQIFRLYDPGQTSTATHAAETLFAFNRWTTAGTNELGIGTFGTHILADGANASAPSADWIFTGGLANFDASSYTLRNMAFYVRPIASQDLYWTAGNGAWETPGAWQTAEQGGEPASFTDRDSATLTAPGSGALTLDQARLANRLTVGGDYTLTGAGSLTVLKTTTLADSPTLTLNLPFATAGIVGAGHVITSADTAVNLAGITAQVMPAYTVGAGTLTIIKQQSGNGIFTGGPSFTVAEGAKVILNGNDIVGWTHADTVNIATVNGTLEKQFAANETFSGQLTLQGSARVVSASAADAFMFHNSARILVAGENAAAAFSGHRFKANNGTTVIDIPSATSRLTFSAPLNAASAISKTGAGELVLEGAVTGDGTVSVNAGTLAITSAWTGANVIQVNANGAIRGTGSLSFTGGWLRGAGTFEGGLNGAGTLTTDQIRPFTGSRLLVTFSEDGSTCGLLKTGTMLFGESAATLTVVPGGDARATLMRYKILEATGPVTLNGSEGVVLSGKTIGWVLEREVTDTTTAWYLKRKPGTLITLF